ncbi:MULTISPECIES: PTS sugar transporter subunit IIA [unclassified Cetobacterium]|uniref:PTS sugar transporter subunit IIA n=1 Tax=unclassified Cetobacterium TaxID=2630983 RepID=UPI0021164766|nr:PTS sugar transporter subunit IIA [Cetobacterium sp. NK01]MCQ8213646.1 PTS sugar transporter subunit IIA [Cetobacterium sp. NK01]
MIQFIVATHGKFAEGIKTSIELIIGNIDNLEILNCYITQNFNLKEEVEFILKKYPKEELIVLTDIFGGSVNNEFLENISNYKNLNIVSGVNLPLILTLIEKQNDYDNIKELIRESIEECSNSLIYCNDELEKKIEEDQEF